MSTVKKRLAFLLSMILIVSFPLSSIVWAEGDNSANGTIPAPVPAPICQTYTKNINAVDREGIQIVIHNNGTATAYFETTMDCVEITFSDYRYDSSPLPYEDQVLFSSHTLKADSPGKYELTIDLPPCGPSQLDLYLGPVQEHLQPGTGHFYLLKYAFQSATGCTTPSPSPSATPVETPVQTPVETPVQTPVETPVQTPVETPVQTPVETPVQTPVETPVQTPVETPVQTPVETPVQTPVETPVQTPVETPVQTPVETPVQTPVETPVQTPVETPVQTPVETPVQTPVETPVQTPVETPVQTPVETPVQTPVVTPAQTPAVTPSVSPSTPSETPPESPEPTETIFIVEEEEIPRGGPDEKVDQAIDEKLPPIDTLPKTGDTSRMPYYLLGSFVLVSGLLTLRQRQRNSK
jgi:LPXTG-motif cell wall-anchored protein